MSGEGRPCVQEAGERGVGLVDSRREGTSVFYAATEMEARFCRDDDVFSLLQESSQKAPGRRLIVHNDAADRLTHSMPLHPQPAHEGSPARLHRRDSSDSSSPARPASPAASPAAHSGQLPAGWCHR